MNPKIGKYVNRQKLLEAIVYFSKGIKNPTKMMMYKLLAELDFRHFEETGMPVTNLEYVAWKRGPVPKGLHEEITEGEQLILPKDFSDSLGCEKSEIETESGQKIRMFLFRHKRKPNLKVFSPRQQRILKEVAEIYKYATATEASKASHEPGKPWTKTIKKYGREGDVIDYTDQLTEKSPVSKQEATEMMEEMRAFLSNYHQ
jgi:uncharacterized phage-associated protein